MTFPDHIIDEYKLGGVCTERSCVHTQMSMLQHLVLCCCLFPYCTSISEVSINKFAGQFFSFYL
jgi:hypothetical protein